MCKIILFYTKIRANKWWLEQLQKPKLTESYKFLCQNNFKQEHYLNNILMGPIYRH